MMLQKMLRKARKEEAGFTLVELLIVVAIIAILAAIAIPQFTKYRLRGFKSELDADTKNAYTASQAYLTDHPGATVTAALLKLGGYMPSNNITVVSSNVTLGTGSIVLKSTALEAAAMPNNSVVMYNGKFTLITLP